MKDDLATGAGCGPSGASTVGFDSARGFLHDQKRSKFGSILKSHILILLLGMFWNDRNKVVKSRWGVRHLLLKAIKNALKSRYYPYVRNMDSAKKKCGKIKYSQYCTHLHCGYYSSTFNMLMMMMTMKLEVLCINSGDLKTKIVTLHFWKYFAA